MTLVSVENDYERQTLVVAAEFEAPIDRVWQGTAELPGDRGDAPACRDRGDGVLVLRFWRRRSA